MSDTPRICPHGDWKRACQTCEIERLEHDLAAKTAECVQLRGALYDEQHGITATLRNDHIEALRDALKTLVDQYRSAPDGPLGRGLTNGAFLEAEKLLGEKP